MGGGRSYLNIGCKQNLMVGVRSYLNIGCKQNLMVRVRSYLNIGCKQDLMVGVRSYLNIGCKQNLKVGVRSYLNIGCKQNLMVGVKSSYRPYHISNGFSSVPGSICSYLSVFLYSSSHQLFLKVFKTEQCLRRLLKRTSWDSRHVFVKYDQDLKTELGFALTSSKLAEGNRLQKEQEAGCHLN